LIIISIIKCYKKFAINITPVKVRTWNLPAFLGRAILNSSIIEVYDDIYRKFIVISNTPIYILIDRQSRIRNSAVIQLIIESSCLRYNYFRFSESHGRDARCIRLRRTLQTIEWFISLAHLTLGNLRYR